MFPLRPLRMRTGVPVDRLGLLEANCLAFFESYGPGQKGRELAT